MTLCTGTVDLEGDIHHDSPCPVHDVRAEADAARESVLERIEAAKAAAPPPDPVLESKGWPWYEARLSIHVRESKPTDTFGEGGEELAHYRASTQAPSFPDAVARLDADLGTGWERIMSNAAMVDQPPSPDVLPSPPPRLVAWLWGLPSWQLAALNAVAVLAVILLAVLSK